MAVEIKTYTKLLDLIRNNDKDRTIKYLETLLVNSKSLLDVTGEGVSTSLKNTIGKEAIDYMQIYSKTFPISEIDSNQSITQDPL